MFETIFKKWFKFKIILKNIKGTIDFHQCQGTDNCIVNFNLKGFKPYAILINY